MGDFATLPVMRMIFVLYLDNVLYALGLTKSLLTISTMIDLRCVAKFDD